MNVTKSQPESARRTQITALHSPAGDGPRTSAAAKSRLRETCRTAELHPAVSVPGQLPNTALLCGAAGSRTAHGCRRLRLLASCAQPGMKQVTREQGTAPALEPTNRTVLWSYTAPTSCVQWGCQSHRSSANVPTPGHRVSSERPQECPVRRQQVQHQSCE